MHSVVVGVVSVAAAVVTAVLVLGGRLTTTAVNTTPWTVTLPLCSSIALAACEACCAVANCAVTTHDASSDGNSRATYSSAGTAAPTPASNTSIPTSTTARLIGTLLASTWKTTKSAGLIWVVVVVPASTVVSGNVVSGADSVSEVVPSIVVHGSSLNPESTLL